MHYSKDHRNYFQTSKGHVTEIIWKVNRIPTHYGVAYESVHSLARGHVISVPGIIRWIPPFPCSLTPFLFSDLVKTSNPNPLPTTLFRCFDHIIDLFSIINGSLLSKLGKCSPLHSKAILMLWKVDSFLHSKLVHLLYEAVHSLLLHHHLPLAQHSKVYCLNYGNQQPLINTNIYQEKDNF